MFLHRILDHRHALAAHRLAAKFAEGIGNRAGTACDCRLHLFFPDTIAQTNIHGINDNANCSQLQVLFYDCNSLNNTPILPPP